MIVVYPMSITTALVSSSIAEPYNSEAVQWTSGNTYAVADKVFLSTTHKIYQCVLAGISTVSPDIDIYSLIPRWVEVNSTNKYAMFDYYRNTPSISTSGNISFTIVPTSRFDTIGFLDLVNVGTLTVLVSKGTSTVMATTSTAISNIVYTDIPPFYGTTITVTLSGSTATTMSVGAVVIGASEYLGIIQRNPVLDINNFSIVDRDIYGKATLQQRRSIPKIQCTTFIESKYVPRLATVRDKLNAMPALWVGLEKQSTDEYYTPLLLLGFYRNFTISMDNVIASTVTLELEEI